MAQMVFEEVVLGVQVDWKTILGNRAGDVLLYRPNQFARANPLTLPETCLPFTIIPPVLIRKPKVPP
jgi:hypothetical protein